jgi:hypothetical protein
MVETLLVVFLLTRLLSLLINNFIIMHCIGLLIILRLGIGI